MWSQLLAMSVWLTTAFCTQGETAENVTHVGCYNVSHGPLDTFKVKYTLSWSECISFCKHRTTKYAAIQIHIEENWYNHCFCFDELEDTLELASTNSSCLSCLDDGNNSCGGNTTASVYKIRESTNHSLLLVLEDSVELIMDNQVLRAIDNKRCENLEFDYSDNVLFCTQGYRANIIRGDYNPHFKKYVTSTIELSIEISAMFTIDWVLKTIYLVEVRDQYNYHSYGSSKQLVKMNYEGKNIILVTQDSRNINQLGIDRFNRLLFYLQNGKLVSFNLTNDNVQKYNIINGHQLLTYTVDGLNNKIYLATSDGSEYQYILSLDYKTLNTLSRIVYRGPETLRVVAMDVFDGELFWINAGNENTNTVYKCKVSPTCLQSRISIIAQRNVSISSLKLYGPRIQIDPCQTKKCSHTCTVTVKKQAECGCPQYMILGNDSVTCKVPDRKNVVSYNVTYFGCFGMQQFERQNHMEHLLTWDQCVDVCDNRRAEYVGIRAEERNSSFNFCYCGLTMENNTQSVSSSCFPCYDDHEQFCGGDETISIYKLRDSVPLMVLLGTSKNIKLLDVDHNVVTDLMNSSDIRSVDFYTAGDDIFFVTNHVVYTTYFSPFTKTYVNKKRVMQNEDARSYSYNSFYTNVAVDWIYKRLYFITGDRLFSCGFTGKLINETRLNHPSNLVLDCYGRLGFYICLKKVCSINLDSYETVEYDLAKHMDFIHDIALDVKQQQIYTFATHGGDPFLVTFGYKSRNLRVLFRGPEISTPSTLMFYDNMVFWENYNNNTHTLFKCKLITPICRPSDLMKIYSTSESINDAKIYNYKLQSFAMEDLCKGHNCSDGCQITEIGLFCSCPSGMELGKNGKTCQATTTVSPDKSTIRAEITKDKTESARFFASSTLQFELYSSTSTELSTRIENNPPIPQPNKTKELTRSADSQHNNNGRHKGILIVFGFILIVVFMIVTSLYIKKRRVNLDISDTYGQASQLELTKIDG